MIKSASDVLKGNFGETERAEETYWHTPPTHRPETTTLYAVVRDNVESGKVIQTPTGW